MRTDLIRKTALTAAGLAFTGGAIAGPRDRRLRRAGRQAGHPDADRPQARRRA